MIIVDNSEMVRDLADRMRQFADLTDAAIETDTVRYVDWHGMYNEVTKQFNTLMDDDAQEETMNDDAEFGADETFTDDEA